MEAPATAGISRTGLAATGYSATLFDGYMPLSTETSSTPVQSPLSSVIIIDKRPRSVEVFNREECLKQLRWSSCGWASLGGGVLGAFVGIVGFMATPASKGEPYGLLLIGTASGAAIGALVGYYSIDERKCAVTTPKEGK
jgi:hypothetical protein